MQRRCNRAKAEFQDLHAILRLMNQGPQKSITWFRKEEIVKLYVEEGLSYREIGERVGASHQTVLNILRTTDVKLGRRRRNHDRAHDEDIRRLYVDEGKPITEVSEILKLSIATVSRSLREQDVRILRGGMRQIVFPELWKLKVGESVELPRVISATKHTYTRYYMMAKKAGIKVSVRVISEDKVRVTRKS